MPRARLRLAQPGYDRRRQQALMEAESIISFAITQALQECPELVQTELLKIMRGYTELLEENQSLRRRLGGGPGGRV